MADFSGFIEKQLAQSRPLTSSSVSVYSPSASTRGILKSMMICNVSNVDASFSMFIDNNGSDRTVSTAIYYNAPISANDTVNAEIFQVIDTSAGSVGIQSSPDGAITFTLSGAEVSV